MQKLKRECARLTSWLNCHPLLVLLAALAFGQPTLRALSEQFTATNITATSVLSAGQVFNAVGANEVFYSHPGGSVNNLNPWGAGAVTSWVEVDLNAASTSTVTITGIDGSRSKNGDFLWLWNGGGCSTAPCLLNLPNQSASSTVNNRFWIASGQTVSVPANEGVLLVYTGASWTAFGATESAVRAQMLNFEGRAAPTALTAGSTTNNYNPWNVAGVNVSAYVLLTATGTGTATLTGLVGPSIDANVDGRIVILLNSSTTTTVALTNNDAGSSNGNKFSTLNGGTLYIGPRRTAILFYDFSGANGIWRQIGGTADLISVAGPAPTVATCGTSPTITGNGPTGTVTIGTGATGCTISFNETLTGTPSCNVSPRVHTNTVDYAVTTTTLTLTNGTASAVYDFDCAGH